MVHVRQVGETIVEITLLILQNDSEINNKDLLVYKILAKRLIVQINTFKQKHKVQICKYSFQMMHHLPCDIDIEKCRILPG